MLGIPADDVLRISAKTGAGVPELLDAVVERIPRADGRRRRAAAGAHVRLDLRRVPRRGLVGARVQRRAAQRRAPALRERAPGPRRRGDRRAAARAHAGRDARSGRGRLPHRRDQGRRRGQGRRDRHRLGPPRRGARRLPRAEADGVLRSVSRSRATSTPTCARRSSGCGSTTRRSPTSPRRRARSASGSAAASSACCTWRSCASASNASTTSRSSRARRTSSTACSCTDGTIEVVDNPSAMPSPQEIEAIEEPYVRITILTPTEYVGTLDGAVAAAAGRDGEDGVPLRGPRRARLRAAARRDRPRLLRPDEVAHARLRQPRLRAGRLPRLEPRQGRRAAQRDSGRRVLGDRAPRQGVRVRARR